MAKYGHTLLLAIYQMNAATEVENMGEGPSTPLLDKYFISTAIIACTIAGLSFAQANFRDIQKINITSEEQQNFKKGKDVSDLVFMAQPFSQAMEAKKPLLNKSPSKELSKEQKDNQAKFHQMQKLETVQEAIREGAYTFLRREFLQMQIFLAIFGVIVFALVGSAGNCGKPEIVNHIVKNSNGPCWIRGGLTAVCFLIGGLTSMLCGWIGMKVAVFANARTTKGAIGKENSTDPKDQEESWAAAFNTAFKGGAVMGFSLCSLGLIILQIVISLYHVQWDVHEQGNAMALFEAIAGQGLGGSSIALFGRVGGGIQTKAADVGADLAGKSEQGLPEDSPFNPATIADNVGDNVGDVAGMGADLFGSFAESTCAALIIASTSPDLVKHWASLVQPLSITALGIVAGILCALIPKCQRVITGERVLIQLKLQLYASTLLTTPLIAFASMTMLPNKFCIQLSDKVEDLNFTWDSLNPAWCAAQATNWGAFVAVECGLLAGLAIGIFTEYMTGPTHKPVKELAEGCEKGDAVNIILGLALGGMSTTVPVILLATTILVSQSLANMQGIALAALGMLSTLSIALTIDVQGPISDNAGGITEMAEQGISVRSKTDTLDAAGNTTAAIGKGFAIGSAALVSLALFSAFVTRAGLGYTGINILQPLVLFGLFIGAMLPQLFSALTMKSVGIAANKMVEEVRRQYKEVPGLSDQLTQPDYQECIKISTEASLHEMILPGALVIVTPLFFGFFFGIQALSGVLVGALISAVQMAISSSNSGGAWDNAKKCIEKETGGAENREGYKKGSDAHKAAITGDTVGDPLKDTSGPALNILMKLMAILSLVFADFFVRNGLPTLLGLQKVY